MSSSASDVLMEGFLTKRAMQSGRNWKRRYFVLKEHAMIYYDERPTEKNDKSFKPKGLVEITAKTIIRDSPVDKKYAFEILSRPQLLCVHAASEREVETWKDTLLGLIETLKKRNVKPREQESKRGFLVKRAVKSGRNWKTRYFVLRSGRLSYYDQPPTGASDRPKGLVEITGTTIVRESSGSLGFGKKHAFHVQTEVMTLYLSAETNKDRADWINAIHLNVLRKLNITKDSEIRVANFLRDLHLNQKVAPVIIDGGFDSMTKLKNISEDDQKTLFKVGNFSMNDARRFQVAIKNLRGMKTEELDKVGKHEGDFNRGSVVRGFEYPKSTRLEKKPSPTLERRLYTFGDDNEFQLGIGASTKGITPEPTHVQALKNNTEPWRVFAGQSCMACISVKKALFTWGTGPLGLGESRKTSNRPFLVASLRQKKIVDVSIGMTHVGAVSEDGEVFMWGTGKKGQLGLGQEDISMSEPRKLETLVGTPIKTISTSSEHTLLLANDGKMYTMGNGKFGRLGLGDESDQYYPCCLESLSGHKMTKIAIGEDFSIAVSKDGCFWWGCLAGEQGPLVPVRLDNFDDRDIDDISAGGEVAAFVVGARHDEEYDVLQSSVYTIGTNCLLLGHGDTRARKKPAKVLALEGHGVSKVSVSPTHVGALCEDGRLLAWGEDDRGQLGNGYLVTVGRPHTAISVAGYRYVWVSCGISCTAAVTEFDPLFAEDADSDGDNFELGENLPPPPPPEGTIQVNEQDQEEFTSMMSEISKLTQLIESQQDSTPQGTTVYAEGWLEHTDAKTGKHYYENQATGKVQWEKPDL